MGVDPNNLQAMQELILAGRLTPTSGGGFTIALAGAPAGTVPPDPNPQPPVDTVIIHPTGGDDAGLIQGELDKLPAGHALMLSGMFQVNNTVWIAGEEKTLTGDPGKQSGLRPMRTGMSGPYGAMLATASSAARCKITSLELDAGNKAVGLVFFDGGLDNSIEDCYLHDIAVNPNGAPYGAIHSQRVTGLNVLRNRIERTGGIKGGEGVRGIYICGASCRIEGNTVRDTGHTGIAVEGAVVTIVGNTIERSLVNGTGAKICYRVMRSSRAGVTRYGYDDEVPFSAPTHYFAQNTVRGTLGGGLMLQDMANNVVAIEGNLFADCGEQGTTFGAIYSSNQANAVTFKNNRVENCRSVGGLQYARNWTFLDSTIVGPNTLHLERECHSITLTRSGQVSIGQNVSDIWVDGVKVA